MEILNKEKLSLYIDHTNLKQFALYTDIKQLCNEAVEYKFASVCILPEYIFLCKPLLQGSQVKICTVVGFPLGSMTNVSKLNEVTDALNLGADEIDMVINLPALINGEFYKVESDVKEIKAACIDHNALLKVIIETCLLTEDQKITACRIVSACKADFIKTSTGFSTGGAIVDDILLLRKYSDPQVKVKAAGGIRSFASAFEMINAGADRIGTSSGIKIINEFISQ
jgi:deoxyribose-phosphate aldolase